MAEPFLGPPKEDVEKLMRVAQTPAIPKPNLQQICVLNGQPKSGNKIDLQRRIIKVIQECADAEDLPRFRQVWKTIYDNAPVNAVAASDRQPIYQQYQPSQPSQVTPGLPPPMAYGGNNINNVNNMAPGSYAPNGYGAAFNAPRAVQPISQSFQYKYSPFYEMKVRLGELKTCEVMVNHRNTITVNIRVQDHPILQQFSNDPILRVMIFCAADNKGAQDICFPHQAELKVNSEEVKANMRGLKNKPGSTKPVDITNLLRFKPPNYTNAVEFTYALTNKAGARTEMSHISKTRHKFYFGVYVCKVTPLETLVKQLASGKKIPKASVVQELKKNASDPDIVATSQNISLKCPLSYMRLKDPARGLKCKHVQCFDITSYLQLQEQGPQWMCPICNNQCLFDHLAIDEYVKDILTNTSSSIEQVTIEPDGTWHIPKPKTETPRPSAPTPAPREISYVGDDDLMIYPATAGNSSRATATPNRYYGGAQSLPGSSIAGSRETSMMPGSARSATNTNGKRAAAETIDLTLSDDDEPPARPAKRQNTGLDNSTPVSAAAPAWSPNGGYNF